LPVSRSVPRIVYCTHGDTSAQNQIVAGSGKGFFRSLLEYFPNNVPALRYRAASLGLLGHVEEGHLVVQQLLALVPDFTITQARRLIEFDTHHTFKKPGVAEALYEGLRRCGVPE
jgi:hypothetical protein